MSVKGSAALASMIKKKSNLLYGEGGEGSPIEGTFGQSPISSPIKAASSAAPEQAADPEPVHVPASENAPKSAPAEPVPPTASAAPAPAPAAPLKFYKPSVTQFSGASKCALCEKTVYKNEEIIAIGKSWHNTCFKCGGQAGDGCGRTLRRDNYSDHNCQPYCNACSSKLFKPQGFGFGGALHLTGTPAAAQVTTTTAQAPEAKEGQEPSAPAVRASPDSSAAGPVPTPPKPLLNEIKTAVQTKEELKPVKYCAKTVNMAFAAVPKCTVCNKSVYKVEEMNAVGRVWHLSCFRCGGTGNEGGCGKVLKRDNYVDHEHNPYCVPCHGKLFRPFGAKAPTGNSISATNSTDSADAPANGNDHGSADANGVTAGLAKLSTQPGIASSKAAGSAAPGAPDASPPSVSATAGGAALNIGASSRSAGGVFKEAAYVGDHDEVAEEEWN